MTYQQVRDVIERIRELLKQARNLWQQTQARADDDGARLVLDWAAAHEQNIQRALAQYSADANTAVLDTWLQYTPDEQVEDTLADLDMRPDMPPDEIAAAMRRFDQTLVDFYRQLADQSQAAGIKDLFEQLARLEEQWQAQSAWNLREE